MRAAQGFIACLGIILTLFVSSVPILHHHEAGDDGGGCAICAILIAAGACVLPSVLCLTWYSSKARRAPLAAPFALSTRSFNPDRTRSPPSGL